MDAVSPVIELTIAAESKAYDADDDRWLAQVSDLYADLRREVPGYRVDGTRIGGTKGVIESVILALGSAGAFTATVECLKAWLGRDKSRRVVITWIHDGEEQRVAIEGDAIDAESLQQLVQGAAEHFGDTP